MSVKIGINGFGRIGRQVLRVVMKGKSNLEVVGIKIDIKSYQEIPCTYGNRSRSRMDLRFAEIRPEFFC